MANSRDFWKTMRRLSDHELGIYIQGSSKCYSTWVDPVCGRRYITQNLRKESSPNTAAIAAAAAQGRQIDTIWCSPASGGAFDYRIDIEKLHAGTTTGKVTDLKTNKVTCSPDVPRTMWL